jgi:tetratricopeptide (TPR) repeat protein
MSYKVIIDIIANGQKAVAEFDKAGRSAERMAKKTSDEVEKSRISMEKFGRQAGIAGAAMIGAAGTIAYAMGSWVKSAQDAERAQMQLESSVKGAYGASSDAVKAFEAQAKAIQKVTVASDEDVMSIQAMLTQFGLTERQVTTLTPLVVDIARKWNIDYVSAAKAVEKSADGKTTALKKLGIQVDETKAKTDPYIATVEALRRAAGGFAEQEGKTFAGQTAILKNQMDELKESLGRGVLSALNDVLPTVNGVAGAFTGLDDKTGNLIGRTTAIATGFVALSGAALLSFSAITKMRTAYDEAAASSTRFAATQKAVGVGFAAVIGYVVGSAIVDGVAKWGDKVNDGVRKALNADTAKEAFTEFERAATAQSSKESSGFINLGKGIGASVVQGASLGSVRLYENLDNKWKRAAFEKTFQKVFSQDPEAARQILNYINADDKRHDAFVRMGVDLDRYQKMVKGQLIDTNRDGVQSMEELQAANEKSAQAADQMISVVTGQAAAARGFADAQASVVTAQKGLVDAQKAYNEAVKTGDPAKIADAQGVLEGAMRTLAAAQDQARDAAYKHGEMLIALGAVAGDTESYDKAIGKLTQMKDLLTDPAEKEAIQQLIDQMVLLQYTTTKELDLNDDKVMESLWRLVASGKITEDQLKALQAQWTVTIDTGSAQNSVDALAGRLEGVRHLLEVINGSGTGSVGAANQQLQQFVMLKTAHPDWSNDRIWNWIANHRASGGPVAGGTPYLVGEQGPELFVPTGNGMIVPNSRLNAIGGSSATGGITVNVSSSALSTPAETGAAVVDALTAWSRRNGRLPAPLVA